MLEFNSIKIMIKEIENESIDFFKQVEENSYINQAKVLDSFRKNRISTRHFMPSTGYGYDDIGRKALSSLFSDIFHTENAIVSPLITSGTQALTITLFGLLRMHENMLSITGAPYDTLLNVIKGENIGSLKDYDINYDEIDLDENGKIDLVKIKSFLLQNKPNLVFITRSEGYSWRNALSINDIKEACKIIKTNSPKSIIMVDNCYGEFVNEFEPSDVGADIIVGSLIKNPGGGIAPTGAYIAGKNYLVEKISSRLTSPSLGLEVGSYNSSYMPFFQGIFLAPSIVSNALKGSILAGNVMHYLGYNVNPNYNQFPNDIIRAIQFNDEKQLVNFIQAIQYSSPIDSFVTPYPWDMPGYQDKVIMAAGTFIQGSSIELSADSPIRKPYIAYLQGGLTYEHYKLALTESISRIKIV